jgi:hypothetical protein
LTDPRAETRPRDQPRFHPAPQCPRAHARKKFHEMRARGANSQCAADGQGLRGAPLALGALSRGRAHQVRHVVVVVVDRAPCPAAAPVRSVTLSSSSSTGRRAASPMFAIARESVLFIDTQFDRETTRLQGVIFSTAVD